MNISTFIKRPVLSTVISIFIVLLGLLGLASLPVEQYPNISPPTISVSTTYTGANAQSVLNSVIAPLEEQINGAENMDYMYSSAANNGSGFEGLADNTPFWNISTGIALIMGRYFPIVGQVAVAGLLASKKFIPESAGTLKTDTGTFSLMTFAVIIIVAALSFFPSLALGPIADYLTF